MFKHNPINNNSNLKEIDYLGSEHVKSLQQSQYIKFENDVARIMEHSDRCKSASITRESMGINTDKKQKMFLRFCKEDEVVNKNQIFLIFKGSFLAKMK